MKKKEETPFKKGTHSSKFLRRPKTTPWLEGSFRNYAWLKFSHFGKVDSFIPLFQQGFLYCISGEFLAVEAYFRVAGIVNKEVQMLRASNMNQKTIALGCAHPKCGECLGLFCGVFVGISSFYSNEALVSFKHRV